MRSQPRRLWLVVILIALVAIASTLTGLASAEKGSPSQKQQKSDLPASCNNNPITASEFRPWSVQIWDRDHWQRKQPGQKILDAKAHQIHCAAGPGHVASMQKRWSKDKTSFYTFRRGALWRAKYRQFEYPDGRRWAVPYPIAWCESGGNYYVGPSGAYGLIPPFPQYMSPKEQDEVAYKLYLELGESPWLPYESGCAYR